MVLIRVVMLATSIEVSGQGSRVGPQPHPESIHPCSFWGIRHGGSVNFRQLGNQQHSVDVGDGEADNHSK